MRQEDECGECGQPFRNIGAAKQPCCSCLRCVYCFELDEDCECLGEKPKQEVERGVQPERERGWPDD